MGLRTDVAVAGSASSKEEQWVLQLDRIIVIDFAEEFLRITELRMEFIDHLVTDNVAAGPNTWPNRSADVRRLRAKVQLHESDTFFYDARGGASPSGVESSDCATLWVPQQDGHTISN